MNAKSHHRGHRGTPKKTLCLRVLCGKSSFVLIVAALVAVSIAARNQTRQPLPPEKRIRYQIHLTLDFENRSYVGTERVRWINRGDHPATTLFFHLYSNIRFPGYSAPADKSGEQTFDEPRLEIVEVRAAKDAATLPFDLDDQETTLRINLREPVAPNASTEVELKFKGSVPEIDPEETGLVTHIVQQVSAAIRSTRELRRARGVNFRCRGVIMLATAFPVLAARDGDEWFRKVELSIGDSVMTESADYEATIGAPRNVTVYSSVAAQSVAQSGDIDATKFAAENLRDFVIV